MRISDNLKYYAEMAMIDGYTTITSGNERYEIEKVIDLEGLNYNDTKKEISYRDLYKKYSKNNDGLKRDAKIKEFREAKFNKMMEEMDKECDAKAAQELLRVEKFGLGKEEEVTITVKTERRLLSEYGKYAIIINEFIPTPLYKYAVKAEVWCDDNVVKVFFGEGCGDKAHNFMGYLKNMDKLASGDYSNIASRGEFYYINLGRKGFSGGFVYMKDEHGKDMAFNSMAEAKEFIESLTAEEDDFDIDELVFDPEEEMFETDEIDIDMDAICNGELTPVIMKGSRLGVFDGKDAEEVRTVSGDTLVFSNNWEVESFIRNLGYEGVFCHFS